MSVAQHRQEAVASAIREARAITGVGRPDRPAMTRVLEGLATVTPMPIGARTGR